MGTLTTIFVIASLILVAITMFAGCMGIVGPRRSSSDDHGDDAPVNYRPTTATMESPTEKRQAA
jgi:hypothetical protein